MVPPLSFIFLACCVVDVGLISSELFWNKLEGYVRTRILSGGRCELLDSSEVYFDSILLLKYKLILAVYLSCSWLSFV